MVQVICIIGLSAAGKTSLAKRLGQEFRYPYFSTGNFEREIARQKGYPDINEYEKKFGVHEAYISLYPQMYKEIVKLSKDSKGIVIEGIYSLNFLETLIKTYGRENVQIFNITSPRHVRIKRYGKREKFDIKKSKREMRVLDKHKFEIGVHEVLKHTKQYAVKNVTSFEDLVHAVKSKIKRRYSFREKISNVWEKFKQRIRNPRRR